MPMGLKMKNSKEYIIYYYPDFGSNDHSQPISLPKFFAHIFIELSTQKKIPGQK